MKETPPVSAMGMVWYNLEDYDAIRGIMADSQKLPATFHEWRMKAESGEKTYRRRGYIVIRAYIDPKTFPDWCRARGLNVDANARNQFAALVAKETLERRQSETGGIH